MRMKRAGGWRHRSLERPVIHSVRNILNDQAGIATTLHGAGISSSEIHSMLRALETRSATDESDPRTAMRMVEFVKRMDLKKEGIEISINLEPVIAQGSISSIVACFLRQF